MIIQQYAEIERDNVWWEGNILNDHLGCRIFVPLNSRILECCSVVQSNTNYEI